MAETTAIQWTDATWNPIRGCSRVSEGCRHCYAEVIAQRFSGPGKAYDGLVARGRWTGEVRFIEATLGLPLRWRTPRRIFVNSMSDLFHERVRDEELDRIFAVMAQASHHTFQVLTKRPERMRRYGMAMAGLAPKERARRVVASMYSGHPAVPDEHCGDFAWPLPGVWLGVSVEDQATADERIPLLLQTPAAIRWVSYEPALGPVDFRCDTEIGPLSWLKRHKIGEEPWSSRIDWVVVGGESGTGARPFNLAWARSTLAQCRAAGVACFVKQLGARAVMEGIVPLGLRDSHGGDPAEWPADLRVREFPRP